MRLRVSRVLPRSLLLRGNPRRRSQLTALILVGIPSAITALQAPIGAARRVTHSLPAASPRKSLQHSRKPWLVTMLHSGKQPWMKRWPL